jgi:sigma-B regulation protein RsbU (phosphoserine phosphatase)
MNVLIAEDDALTRLMLQRAIEHQGHACLVAQDGLEAWQLFQAHTVDVVISDWLMPLMDGVELCRRVRKQTDRACGYASRCPHQLTPSSWSVLARLRQEVSTGAMT